MRVGIDLDNTIINYSKVFLKICNKYNLKINKENPKVKLKTYLRKKIFQRGNGLKLREKFMEKKF